TKPLKLLRSEPLAQIIQPIAQRSVVNRVADADQHTTQQLRVDGKLHFDFLPRQLFERSRHLFFLIFVQGQRGENLSFRKTLPFAHFLLKCLEDLRNSFGPLVVDREKQKFPDNLPRAQAGSDLSRAPALSPLPPRGAGKKIPQLGGRGRGGGEAPELLGHCTSR